MEKTVGSGMKEQAKDKESGREGVARGRGGDWYFYRIKDAIGGLML